MAERPEQLIFPEEVIPKSKKNRLGSAITVTSVSTSVLATLALLAYGAREATYDLKLRIYGDGHLSSPKREKGIEGLLYYYNLKEDLDDNSKELLISTYLDARQSFANFADYEFKTNYNDETRNFVSEQREKIVLDGCNLLGRLGMDIKVSTDGRFVEFLGLTFHLENTYDQLLLDQIVFQEIAMARAEEHVGTIDKFQALKRQSDLIWLAQHNLPITFTNDSFPLITDDTLVYISRFYRTIKDLDYPIPETIDYKIYPGRGSVGRYFGSVVEITNNSGPEAIVHESAHFQADVNKKFGQREFNKRVNRAKQDIVLNFEDHMYINKGVLDKSWTDDPEIEDYAETIKVYFSDGVAFRRRLKELELLGDPAFPILKVKYDFAKEFFGGKEFVKMGGEFQPIFGDIFEISDPDKRLGSGIFLRPDPNLNRDGSYPVVHDTYKVLIDDGPVDFFDPETGVTKRLWHVQLVDFPGEPYEYHNLNESGWVSQDWLGDKLTPFAFPLEKAQ